MPKTQPQDKKIGKLLELATNTKKGGSSNWAALIISLVVALIIGVMSFQAVRAKRKAAKLAHDLRKLRSDKAKTTLESRSSALIKDRDRALKKVSEIRKKIEKNEDKVKELDERHKKFVDSLENITNWAYKNM